MLIESDVNAKLRRRLFNKVSKIIFESQAGKDISSRIDYSINDYRNFLLKEIDDDYFKTLKTSKRSVEKAINHVKEIICNSINAFLQGDVFEAVRGVNRLFSFLEPIYINQDTPLYRGRVGITNYLFERDKMFHIPLNKRNLVKNQRFSLSGFPCLYLGKTTFTCWEELERPDFGMCNFVSLKSTKQFSLIDLSFPYEIAQPNDFVKIAIVIACSLKANKEDDFKTEYILPQLILHYFIKHRNKKKSEQYGIAYHSTSMYNEKEHLFKFTEDITQEEMSRYLSFVIPVLDVSSGKTIGNNKFCSELVNLFNISESISSNIRGFQKSLINNYIPLSLKKYESLYPNSCFGDIDKYLKTANMSKLGVECLRESSYDPTEGGSRIYMEETGFSGELPQVLQILTQCNRKPKCQRFIIYYLRQFWLTLKRVFKS